jgi:hypothetical protein
MNVFVRFLRRLRFRRTLKIDESTNVVDGIVKARKLYKELCAIAHPDRNQYKSDIAEEIMKRIVANKHNYSELLFIQKEVEEKLL